VAFFSVKSEQTFGLDVDETSIKMVQLQQGTQGYSVAGAAWSELPASVKRSTDPMQVTVDALREGLEKSEISSRHAVTGIGGDDVSLRCFEFPALEKKELSQAILLEAEQSCPFELDSSVVDYYIHDAVDERVKGVTVAARKDAIVEKERLIQDSGLQCALMDVNDLALLNCFNETETLQENQSAILLNIGSTMSHLIVLRHGCDPFFRNIPHGQKQFVKELANEHEESPQTIQKILFDPQALGSSQLNLTISLTRIFQPLISDIMETIRYYHTQHKVDSLDRMLVSGDFSLVTHFNEVLDAHLPFPVECWNPFTKMSCQKSAPLNDLLIQSGSAMVIAAGLAMRRI
jgi:type IV pilus assembly protein PilM